MRSRPILTGLLAVLTLIACQRDDDQRTDTIHDQDVLAARAALSPAVVAELDDGNAAYRDRDYERALQHFQAAVDMNETLAAGWFGIYMAQLALGNPEAAEAAMQHVRTHAPGATLIHPDPDMPVPADHPAVRDTQP
jgi:tetratricopeptide (TPR) repeat protein